MVSPALAACVVPPVAGDKPAEWIDLISLDADKSLNQNIKFVQSIASTGTGDINLDYYALTIKSDESAQSFFALWRKDLPKHLFDRSSSKYVYALKPYSDADSQTWTSDNPKGALMSFTLAQVSGVIEFERGSVVVSCSDATSFVFSTVNTQKDGDHPVSGNRGFGVVKNADGTLTLFTKGADRIKSSSYFSVLGSAQREAIFFAGTKIWEHLLDHLEEEYKNRAPSDRQEISGRYPYPISTLDAPPTSDSVSPIPHAILPFKTEDQDAAFRNGVRQFDLLRSLYGSVAAPLRVCLSRYTFRADGRIGHRVAAPN